jgi:O-antigen/teichoic acid export membrane protein
MAASVRATNIVRFIKWWLLMLVLSFCGTFLLLGGLLTTLGLDKFAWGIVSLAAAFWFVPWVSRIREVYRREYKWVLIATAAVGVAPAVLMVLMLSLGG